MRIETKVVDIDRDYALQLLENNIGNRRIRSALWQKYSRDMKRGAWGFTHQGIAISETGILLDGQHRLIGFLYSGIPSFRSMVTTGLPNKEYAVMDVGTKRSNADILKVPQREMDAINLLTRFIFGFAAADTPDRAKKVYEHFRNEISQLVAACGSKATAFSTGAVKAAAIVQMKLQPTHFLWITEVYRMLVLHELENLTPSALTLVKQVLSGKTSSSKSQDLFSRALHVFDFKKKNMSRIQISDPMAAVLFVRDTFSFLVNE